MVIAAIALVAIAAWPLFALRASAAKPSTMAVVLPDYQYRDKTVAFYEARVKSDTQDQISATMLAAQYMQRYRESADVGDLVRSIAQAKRALVLQPQNNAGADGVLGSAYTALHQFTTALTYERAAFIENPYDSNAPAQIASLDMELGRYADAAHFLTVATRIKNTPTVMSVQARYDELTGNLATARILLATAAAQTDDVIDNSAQGRAWFHFREGELAFSAGDVELAKQDERDAVAMFPGLELGYRALARFCWATKDWQCTIDAADKGATITPIPEELGYEADAQAALGQDVAADQTRQLIFAIERVGNAYHLSDRLIAVYYTEHHLRPDDALAIARREVVLRGTEIYAQDTLSWAAAQDGKWNLARTASAQAMRYHTQDPRILYHAGLIAQHFGNVSAAQSDFAKAKSLNPTFEPNAVWQ
jgi:tetratricopeptide (TPR) repeat protein